MPRRNKSTERELALARIQRLFHLAVDSQRSEEPASSARYVQLARRIAMRYQVSIPSGLRRQLCRSCGALLIDGKTARHRIIRGRLSVTCLRCGTVKRYPFKPARGRRT